MAAQAGEQELRTLVECLKNSLSGHDRNKQKEAELVCLQACVSLLSNSFVL